MKTKIRILNRRVLGMAIVTTLLLVAATAIPAYADTSELKPVIDNIRNWLTGILAGIATVFLTIGGLRYLTAMGNQRALEQGKEAIKSSMIGYALAVLAPLLVEILRKIVNV